jgi:hypothetical protein
MLPQEKYVRTELRPLRQIGSFGEVRRAPAFVLDGDDDAVRGSLDDVDFCRQSEPLGSKPNRPCDVRAASRFIGGLRRRKRATRHVGPRMHHAPFERVSIVGKFLLRPLQEHEPLTIENLVDHPRRDGRKISVGSAEAVRKDLRGRRREGRRRSRWRPTVSGIGHDASRLRAQAIVIRDADLITLVEHEGIAIITPKSFVEVIIG